MTTASADTLPGMSRDQTLVLLGQALTPDAATYSTPSEFHIAGRVDPARFRDAWAEVVGRVPILQDRFRLPHGRLADPAPDATLDVEVADDAGAVLADRRGRVLDLDDRAWDSVLVLEPERSVWFLNVHQVVADQQSILRLFAATSSAYAGETPGTVRPAPQDVLDGRPRDVERSRAFWQRWSAETFVEGWATAASAVTSAHSFSVAVPPERRALLTGTDWDLPGSLTLLAACVGLVAEWHRRARPELDYLCLGIPWHNRGPGEDDLIGPLMRVTPLQVPLHAPPAVAADATRRGLLAGLANRHWSPSNPPHRPLYDCLLNLAAATLPERFAGFPVRTELPSSGSTIERLNIQVFGDADGLTVLVKQRDADAMNGPTLKEVLP